MKQPEGFAVCEEQAAAPPVCHDTDLAAGQLVLQWRPVASRRVRSWDTPGAVSFCFAARMGPDGIFLYKENHSQALRTFL